MRLLVVTNDYPPKPGGIQQYLGSLLGAYPNPVRVLAPHDEPASESPLGEHVVSRWSRRFMWPTPSVAEWVASEARAFGAQAVLFGAPYPLARLGPTLRERLGLPYGVLCHGAEVTIPAVLPVTRQLLAGPLRAADVRFAVSRFTARRVEALTGREVQYVGAGINTTLFTPTSPDGVAPRSRPVIGCVSRFVPRKGQDRLIRAVAELGEPVELLMVGKGRKEPELRRLVDRLGVEARFEVDVPWKRLPELYQEMDIFCMPCRSRWGGLEVEGLGLVFLEAAASGLPVLAGDSGGSPETVIPGETGFVVRSVGDIVEGLHMLLSDPVRARKMGLAGRDFVASEFTWEQSAQRIAGRFAALR